MEWMKETVTSFGRGDIIDNIYLECDTRNTPCISYVHVLSFATLMVTLMRRNTLLHAYQYNFMISPTTVTFDKSKNEEELSQHFYYVYNLTWKTKVIFFCILIYFDFNG